MSKTERIPNGKKEVQPSKHFLENTCSEIFGKRKQNLFVGDICTLLIFEASSYRSCVKAQLPHQTLSSISQKVKPLFRVFT